jgi:selenocysteine-specific elongation factor
MTIDLGYAFLTLPSGRKVGIVDVPGHERFIRNMLAGAGGFDLVLLVVAADEGVMPQTREHLDILNLLEVKSGLVVLTKIDLAESEEWIKLVEAEVISVLRNTTLEKAPIIRFSARTGEGKEEVIKALDKVLEETPPKPSHLPARFPIDWVFSKPGFGTVVRGTLWEGKVRKEQKVDLLPQGREIRIRGMQRHGEPIEEGKAGQRIAINLAGVEKREVKRGDVLVEKGAYRPTSLLDVRLTLLENTLPLKHGDEYLFYLGAKETMVKVRLMERDVLKAGEEGFAQLRLRESVVARRGDRFILRRPSPLITIGGGVVLEAYPRPHHRFHLEEVQVLKRKLYTSDEEYFLVLVSERPGISLEEVYLHLALGKESEDLVKKMLKEKKAFLVGDSLYEAQRYGEVKKDILEKARIFFEKHPQNPNIPKEELRTMCALSKRVFEEFLSHLEKEGSVFIQADKVRLAGVKSKLSALEEKIKDKILTLFKERPFNPPTLKEIEEIFKEKREFLTPLIKLLQDEKLILRVAPGLFFYKEALERAKEITREKIEKEGSLTPSQFKEILGTSRKYAIPLLEYFDKIKLTKREGDRRVLYS